MLLQQISESAETGTFGPETDFLEPKSAEKGKHRNSSHNFLTTFSFWFWNISGFFYLKF